MVLALATAPRGDIVDALARAQDQPDGPLLPSSQVHVADLLLADARSAFDGVPIDLPETRGIGPHARRAVALWQAVADFLQAFIDQLSGEVDVHVVFEVHGDVGQAEQADRADLLHLRQACQRRLHRRGQQLFDVLGGQAGRFGVDVDLGRGDIRKGVDGHRANRADPEERDHQEDDQDQEFVA